MIVEFTITFLRSMMLVVLLCSIFMSEEQWYFWKTLFKSKLPTILYQPSRYDSSSSSTSDDEVEDVSEYDSEIEQFKSQSESDTEEDLDRSEGKIITKHLQVLNDIENTEFRTNTFSLTSNYFCKNRNIYIQPCFCNKCGNYVCFRTEFATENITCDHYELFDSINSKLDNISGHIHIGDKRKVISIVDSLLQSEEDTEIKKAKLMELVYDTEH